MGIISKLLGSDKAMDKASKGIDKLFFTKEEKAASWIATLKAYEPFKIAQRLIALIVVTVFVLMVLLSALMYVLSHWFMGLDKIAEQIWQMNNESLGLPITVIIAFYFAGGAVEGVVTRFRK